MRVRVLIRPKEGILDPQGQAVERALPALGFGGVSNVHVGRLIELEVDDLDRLPGVWGRLLSNPLIENYEIVESAGADSIGSSAGAELPGAGRAGGAELPGAVESAGADSIGSSAGAE